MPRFRAAVEIACPNIGLRAGAGGASAIPAGHCGAMQQRDRHLLRLFFRRMEVFFNQLILCEIFRIAMQ
jgi:hypothetical protein